MAEQRGGVELHADWDGPPGPEERTLVLLHGFTGDISTWEPVRPGLRRLGKTLALDLVGHGKSPKPDDATLYSMEACSALVVAVLDRHALGPVWLVGYSMGGRVALHLAARHPERVAGLIVISASPGLENADARAARAAEDRDLAESIIAWGVPAFVERWLNQPLFATLKQLSAEQQAVQRAQRLRNSPVGLANSLRGMGTGAMHPLWDDLPFMPMPTLIHAGQQDAKFVDIARRMEALLPHATLHLFPGAGHLPHVTNPAAWLEQVEAFFGGA